MKKKMKCLLFSCLFSLPYGISSQPEFISLSRDILRLYDQPSHSLSSAMHTSIKPFLVKELRKLDSVKQFVSLFGKKNSDPFSSPGKKSLKAIPCLLMKPVYDLRGSKNAASLETTVGPLVKGMLGDKFAFAFNFWTGRASFAKNLDSIIRSSGIVPGMGSAYGINGSYTFQHYTGYASYSPNEIFNFQAGMDKNFLGDGYRSLFLSDVSNTYPFLKISTSVWKIKYVNIFASLKDVSSASGLKQNFINKFATFHYLSWNVSKRVNLNFFESVIWQGSDSIRSRGFDINYLNPVIFYRPVEYSLGSSDNSLIGFGFKIKAGKKQVFYGQLMLDEFLLKEVLNDFKKLAGKNPSQYGWWANKQAGQVGLKSFDLFRLAGLNFQTEVNIVRPFTYSHGSTLQSYGHYNQPLAHPLGANFIENVSFLSYRHKNLVVEGKLVTLVYGADTSGVSYGQDIYKSYTNRSSEYGNDLAQGVKTTLMAGELRGTWMLIPKWNLQAEFGISQYLKKSDINTINSFLVFGGLKSSLMNWYDDF